MPDGIDRALNARVEFWTLIINRVGVPTTVLIAFGFFGYTFYNDIGKPVAATHISTLNTLAESSKSTAESFNKLATAHEDTVTEARLQKQLLERIGNTQIEIKQVLSEQLKVTKSSATEAHQDARPEPGPPGTELD